MHVCTCALFLLEETGQQGEIYSICPMWQPHTTLQADAGDQTLPTLVEDQKVNRSESQTTELSVVWKKGVSIHSAFA